VACGSIPDDEGIHFFHPFVNLGDLKAVNACSWQTVSTSEVFSSSSPFLHLFCCIVQQIIIIIILIMLKFHFCIHKNYEKPYSFWRSHPSDPGHASCFRDMLPHLAFS